MAADDLLELLEFEAKDASDGNLLEFMILICSWSLLTQRERASSLPSSWRIRKGCCYITYIYIYGYFSIGMWVCILTKSPSIPGRALGSFCMLEWNGDTLEWYGRDTLDNNYH